MDALPHALVFDFDGTIIDTESTELASLRDLWSAHNLTFEDEVWMGFLGLSPPDWASILADKIGGGADRTEMQIALDQNQMARTAIEPLRPGVRRIIEAAISRDIPLAIASNGQRQRIEETLEQKNLEHMFGVVVTQEDVTNGKPAKDAYLLACAQLGAEPSRCVAFEDSMAGLRSANDAGLRTVACPTKFTATQDFSAAEVVVSNLESLSIPDLLSGSLVAVEDAENRIRVDHTNDPGPRCQTPDSDSTMNRSPVVDR